MGGFFMKILILADAMDIGGVETHVYELSRALFSMGHRVKIFSDGGRTASLLSGEAELFKCPCTSGLSLTRAAGKLLAVLQSFKPDVVHAHTRKTLFLANSVLKVLPFPLVFTAHAKFSSSRLKAFLTKPPLNTIAVSRDIGKDVKDRFGAKSVTVIPNGIDTDRFTPGSTADGCLKILHVSRLDTDCSVTAELLCKIAPRLAKLFPRVEIRIVGGGNALERIKLFAKRANRQIGKNAVICLGAKSDVLPFIRQSNLFVGVSRAALEAMACGLPTVICGNEGYFGICREENFELCARENFCARGYPNADGDRLFSDIVSLYKKGKPSPAVLSGKVKYGFNALVMAQKTEAVYKKAIQDFSASRHSDAVICGYYGFGNLGDELVLEKIKEALSPLRISVIGARGGSRICRFNLIKIIRAIRSTSVLVLGGGSLLQNATSNRSLYYYLSILRIANFFGRKIMLYANGFGPLTGENAQKKCAAALAHTDKASFRDADSLACAKKLLTPYTRAYATCDPALSPILPKQTENRIAVLLRGKDCTPALLSELCAALLRFRLEISPENEIIFASINSKYDERPCKKAASQLGFKFTALRNAADAYDLIASSKITVSSRLHALILAASSGRPFVTLCHDPKLSAFAKELSLPPALLSDVDSENLSNRLFEALAFATENEALLCAKITQTASKLSKKAKRDKKELFDLLKF